MDPFTISLFFFLASSSTAVFSFYFLLSFAISSNIIHPRLLQRVVSLLLLLLLLFTLVSWCYCTSQCLFIYSLTVENCACIAVSVPKSRVWIEIVYYNFLISCHSIFLFHACTFLGRKWCALPKIVWNAPFEMDQTNTSIVYYCKTYAIQRNEGENIFSIDRADFFFSPV